MGVLGLAPFLQKTCPQVIKTLPNRLNSFSGKTIAIDGTLITQRLHFAPMPHQYRHVLGWYRIVKELQECNVNVICVFDGKERSIAKEAEIERRRDMRRQTVARYALEKGRSSRLKTVLPLYQSLQTFGPDEKERVARTLRELVDSMDVVDLPAVLPLPPDVVSNLEKEPPPTLARTSRTSRTVSLGEVGESDSMDIPLRREDMSTNDSDVIHADETYEPLDTGFVEEAPRSEAVTQLLSSEDVSSGLASSFLQYRHSIPKLLSLSQSLQESPATGVEQETSVDQPEDVVEKEAEYAMSKAQHQLTLDEGKFWETFLEPDSAEGAELPTPMAAHSALMEKSTVISESYMRRVHPPTTATYAESKEILRAMGVPCIEPLGPYEAEALASALVLSGYADYVASEDTDVLVYGVPLVRNIANRRGPLEVISGADVRGQLQLDPASFVDFALLLGTDFSPRIKNVGPARALRFIRAHGSIERVLECEPKYPPRVPQHKYLALVGSARMVFDTLPPIPEVEQLRPRESDEEEVVRVLQHYGFPDIVHDRDEDHSRALSGGYYQDDPAAS
ncbi:PIN domain-like protein [Amylocystis lapponica]|nr:PIN domain-like protein [Amylocystis lapponica]